jgi:hypothetical protein
MEAAAGAGAGAGTGLRGSRLAERSSITRRLTRLLAHRFREVWVAIRRWGPSKERRAESRWRR